MSSPLRVAVHVAPGIPAVDIMTNVDSATWSPTACTLIYSAKEAVLVDTPISIDLTDNLIAWIEKIAPGRKLSYIYITHGHPDHFYGIPQLLKRFPEAVPVATAGTVAHMQDQISDKAFNGTWSGFFPNGQLYHPQQVATALPASNEFVLEGRWKFQAIEVGHSDTHDSTILWQPDLKLAVCGDVVYGQVHQMLFAANTKAKREEWIQAVEKVEALEPIYVVPGHRQEAEMDGVWHLAATKQYLKDFGEVLKKGAKEPGEVYKAMLELYPDRFNPMVLGWGCQGAFQVTAEERV